MQILITGGVGFIGSHVVRLLVNCLKWEKVFGAA
jgi:nucleoside-diphosphate-sugar epimerase